MKARATVKDWVRQGNPNIKHHSALLDAELAALQRKRSRCERHYQSALAIAIRGGLVHDAALANERYGDFALSVLDDNAIGKFHVKEAIRLYSEWGAAKKVQLLEVQHASLLST